MLTHTRQDIDKYPKRCSHVQFHVKLFQQKNKSKLFNMYSLLSFLLSVFISFFLSFFFLVHSFVLSVTTHDIQYFLLGILHILSHACSERSRSSREKKTFNSNSESVKSLYGMSFLFVFFSLRSHTHTLFCV